MDNYLVFKIGFGVLATFGLYSVLYRENKFYRFWEHIFLGLAAGYTVVATWKDTLFSDWFMRMLGTPSENGSDPVMGYWAYAAVLPIAFMGYLIFSKKHSWMSKIPLGVILGVWSGQQIAIWWDTYGPQIYNSMLPIVPTTFDSITKPASYTVVNGAKVPVDPAVAATIASNIYPTQALTNLIFVATVVAAFSYFLFSFELKSKWMRGINTYGRWMLMIGFGAIFGSTVMARFALVIDRMSFFWNEFLPLLTRR